MGNYFAGRPGSGTVRNFLLSQGSYETLDVPGSTLDSAQGINDLGQIVGYYQDSSFAYHGFLATPVPEPSTLLLLAIGTLGVIGWMWRRRKVAMRL